MAELRRDSTTSKGVSATRAPSSESLDVSEEDNDTFENGLLEALAGASEGLGAKKSLGLRVSVGKLVIRPTLFMLPEAYLGIWVLFLEMDTSYRLSLSE